MKLSIAFVLVIAGCSYDLSLDSQSVEQDAGPPGPEAGSDAGPALPPLPPGVSYMREGACRILADGPNVLVACGPQLRRLARDGSATVLMTVDHGWVEVYAQDAARIYLVHEYKKVLTPAGESDTRYSILAFDKATAEITILTSDWEEVAQATTDDKAIYFATELSPESYDPYRPRGQLVRVDKQTGHTHVLYVGLRSPMGLAVDSRYVYVADDMNHRLVAVAKSGGLAFDVAQNVNRPSSVLPHGDWLYFTERGNTEHDGKISRVARPTSAGQGVVETLADGLAHPTEVVIDGEHVYATSYFLGLYRAAATPGGATSLVFDTRVQGLGPIAISEHRVYFSSRYPDNTGSLIYVADTTLLQ